MKKALALMTSMFWLVCLVVMMLSLSGCQDSSKTQYPSGNNPYNLGYDENEEFIFAVFQNKIYQIDKKSGETNPLKKRSVSRLGYMYDLAVFEKDLFYITDPQGSSVYGTMTGSQFNLMHYNIENKEFKLVEVFSEEDTYGYMQILKNRYLCIYMTPKKGSDNQISTTKYTTYCYDLKNNYVSVVGNEKDEIFMGAWYKPPIMAYKELMRGRDSTYSAILANDGYYICENNQVIHRPGNDFDKTDSDKIIFEGIGTTNIHSLNNYDEKYLYAYSDEGAIIRLARDGSIWEYFGRGIGRAVYMDGWTLLDDHHLWGYRGKFSEERILLVDGGDSTAG